MGDTSIEWADKISVEYRDIADFPGYRVGTDGSVWSRWAYNGRNPRRLGDQWKPMKAQPDGDGYLALNLFRTGRSHRKKVHLLVLETFVGTRPDGMQGCHENGKVADCSLTNLRWDTPTANQRDRLRHGTEPRGEKSGRARLTSTTVLEIRRRAAAGESAASIAAAYRVSPSTARAVIRGQNWGWLNG